MPAGEPPENAMEMVTDSAVVELRNAAGAVVDRVNVYKIRLKDMQLLSSVWEQLDKEAEVYTRKAKEWVEKLSDDHLMTVVEGGRRINFSLFQRWLNLRLQSLQALQGKGVDKLLAEAVRIASLPSPKS